MYDVIILGYGNVAQSLELAIANTTAFRVRQVFCRNPNLLTTPPKSPVTDNLNTLGKADLYLVCVSDDAITSVSSQLPFNDRLVVHTSGTVAVDALKNQQRAGVFYPLQSFSKEKKIDWKTVPLCLETTKTTDLKLLKKLASSLSDHVFEIDSAQRKKLHLAAVIVNNFVNHLYHLGARVCEEHNIPFEILHPLILETAKKIQHLSPFDAQTGPARRNDQKTLNSQLLQVHNTPLEEIYNVLTSSIVATYGREKL